MGKFTLEQVLHLKNMGWEFVPTGPRRGWIKYNKNGNPLAREGYREWYADVETILEEEVWKPTMELRVRVKRAFGTHIVEQKFIRVVGSAGLEWRPLPMVDDEGKPL